MSQDNIEAIEKEIADGKNTVELGDAIERLRINRDFKRVVIEGYFEKEAIRLVHLLADPAMQTPVARANIVASMEAIGNFSQYLSNSIRFSDMARKLINDCEVTREEMLAEGLSDE